MTQAKCVVVCWSRNASDSSNVKYEARVANDHGKLIPLMLEPMKTGEFPMGLDVVQSPDLEGWRGDVGDAHWRRIQKEIEIRVAPLWAKHAIHRLEAGMLAEKKRRESAESHEGALRLQLEQEVQKRVELERTRDTATNQVREDLENLRVHAETLSLLVFRLVKQIKNCPGLIKRRGEIARGTVTYFNKAHGVALVAPDAGGPDIVVAIDDDDDEPWFLGTSEGARLDYFLRTGMDGVAVAVASQPSD